MALGRWKKMRQAVQEACSGALRERLCKVGVDSRPRLVMLRNKLVSVVCDNVGATLSLWNSPPCRLLAALGKLYGVDRPSTKRHVQACLDNFDSQPNAVGAHHRVVLRFLGSETAHRSQLESFAQSGL